MPAARLTHVSSPLEPANAAAVAALSKFVTPPPSGVVSPLLGARDVLVNDKRAFALTSAFKLPVAEAVSGGSLVVPRAHRQLYESPFDAQLVTVISADRNVVVATSDTFPESLSLAKGDYWVVVQVRSDDVATLESLRGRLGVNYVRPLAKKIDVKVAYTLSGQPGRRTRGGGAGIG